MWIKIKRKRRAGMKRKSDINGRVVVPGSKRRAERVVYSQRESKKKM